MGKRFRELTQTAAEADLVSGNYFGLDCENVTKKLPGNAIAPRSGSTSEIRNLPDKNEGYLALNDGNGTGKFDIEKIFGNFVNKDYYTFNPSRTSSNAYKVNEFVLKEGVLYVVKNPHYGPWNADNFVRFGIGNNYDQISLQVLNDRGVGIVPYTATAMEALKIFKKVRFYDANFMAGRNYFITALYRHVGFSQIRLNVTYNDGNGNVTISFVCPDPDPTSTGVQHYVLTSDPDSRQIMEVDIDWDAYDGSVFNITGFKITEQYSDVYAIGHSLNETWTNQSLGDQTLAPVRKISGDGVLKQVCADVGTSGTAYILVGTIKPSLLFEERARYAITLNSGVNILDVSELGICVYAGENIALRFNGTRKYCVSDGTPDSDSSYYYSTYAPQQLERYGIQTKQIAFAFNVTVGTSYKDIDLCQTKKRETIVTPAISRTFENNGIADFPTTVTAQKALEIFQRINFYDPTYVAGRSYFITALYRHIALSQVRLNVTYNDGGGNVTISFVCPDPDPTSTGVQHYVLTSDPDSRQIMDVTIDWDAYDGSIFNITGFQITEQYSNLYAIGHSLNETWQTQDWGGWKMLVPIRKISEDGVLKQVCIDVGTVQDAEIIVGEVDQYLLFIERARYAITLNSGVNILDVSDLGICVYAGENVALRFRGYAKQYVSEGLPDSVTSYYYTNNSGMQLEIFGISNRQIAFAFNFVVDSGFDAKSRCRDWLINQGLSSASDAISKLQNSSNVFRDSSGNRYVLEIVNGSVVPELLDFRHILIVGNSYTVHPTVSDNRPELATNLWWGHWSMAASDKDVSWTNILLETLREKYGEDVSVYPVFGRPYELGGSIDADTSFVYWDANNNVKNFVPNISHFSDVDCIVLFLGENYNGDNISSWYTALISKFRALFPGRMVYCVGTRTNAEKSEAISAVASELNCRYISMLGKGTSSKLGSYVLGDDGNLHQIDNGAVASHPGDAGQIDLAEIVMDGLSIPNNISSYKVILSDSRLSVKGDRLPAGCIVSVFGDGVTSISANSGAIEVTPHLNTTYGNVFTFTMPSADVSVSVST